ncbi:MAG: GlcNAc-PI de-N-acetylase [Rhodospirillaceae bacterium]|nr:GlcNAc-PI de-N-acetylase [Rhodospirillaceae bacterium]|tara:strand:- start:3584 stop:4264 length:681 start_codon:yes stop_codon:yes gene_type:complete
MNILVVAAHPDDEVLGCGGTIRRHADAGDTVDILCVCDGVSARRGSANSDALVERRMAAKQAANILGAQEPKFLDFPDNRLDEIPLLDIVREIEATIEGLQPKIVYTHFVGDLNIDHTIVSRAVLTACRPLKGSNIERILNFEIPSSTEWASPQPFNSFTPQYFIDIDHQLEAKLAAIRAYEMEIREFPHPRSVQAIKALAHWRGATAGLSAAEAFHVERLIINDN